MAQSNSRRFILILIVIGILVFFFKGAPDEAQPQPEKPVVKMNIDREKTQEKEIDLSFRTILVKTYGNWAYNRKANQTSVELINKQNISVSQDYLPAFMPAKRGEKTSLTGIETTVSALRVHFFAGQELATLDFDLPEALLEEEAPEVTLLISPYRLAPRASWVDKNGTKHYFWPRGREDWPNGDRPLTEYRRTKKTTVQTVKTQEKATPKKKKKYVSKRSVVQRNKRTQYHTSYKWGNWSKRFGK